MREWHEPQPVTVSDSFQAAIGGHPLVAEILVRRGYTNVRQALAFLDPAYYNPADPSDLPDLDAAAERLKQAIEAQERILVWGDFDVDGQTSTSLLVDALRELGAVVRFHVPHRMKHGHGVHTEVLKGYYGEADVLLTCDTGIAAHRAIEAAQLNGMTVLITDHHALPPELPEAEAVVNPQRLPKAHPLRDLPGVGVSYLLMKRLYALFGQAEDVDALLDLVALGIVCDVATQRLDTRYLLQLGIDQLRNPTRIGLQALMKAAGVIPTTLSSDTIGFQIGPRLNALGRLDDATKAVQMLTMESMPQARRIAEQLELLNQQRKQIERQIYAAAQAQIAADASLLDFEALVLSAPTWHTGVIGIVASRLVEQYGKPTVLIATPPGRTAGGSARSVPGVDIGACIAAQSDILLGYGGHPGAAGIRIDPDLIPQFRRRLSNTVDETRDRSVKLGHHVDAVIPLGDLSLELAEQLDRLSPFGAGNPPIHVVVPHVTVTAYRDFGANKVHRRVTISDEAGTEHDVTWWRGSEHAVPEDYPIDLLAIPRINDWRGSRTLQLEWVDSRPAPGVVVDDGPRYTVIDEREKPDPIPDTPPDELLIWAEAAPLNGLPAERIVGRGTDELARTLVIWTVPPGAAEAVHFVEKVGARTLHIAARHTPNDSAEAFLTRLAGLVKYALRAYGGATSLTELAAATAQREVTVRRGLEVLAAQGQITLEWGERGRVHISRGGQEAPTDDLLTDLQALLAETAAFRSYFLSADLETFFES